MSNIDDEETCKTGKIDWQWLVKNASGNKEKPSHGRAMSEAPPEKTNINSSPYPESN